jgi:hypothetical protein
LLVVAAPERYFSAAEDDDNIAVGNVAVTSYPHFGGLFGAPLLHNTVPPLADNYFDVALRRESIGIESGFGLMHNQKREKCQPNIQG